MITDTQFQDAAKLIGCNVSVIKAVYEVEANGSGFLDDGAVKGVYDSEDRVKTLFEGHRFWKNIKKAGKNPSTFIAQNPQYSNVLYEKWDKKKYKGGAGEWTRISLAIEVCNELNISTLIALDSASYGSFQILGSNAVSCGYSNSHEMLVSYNSGGEPEQLLSFCKFVKSRHLDEALVSKNWVKFAEGYNGTQQALNNYSGKLKLADYKFTK